MVERKRVGDAGFIEVAQGYVNRSAPSRTPESLASAPLRWDERYCRQVALWFDQGPTLAYGSRLRRRYDRFKQENIDQYHAITRTGIKVEPWHGPGQPYRGSADLRQSVRSSGVLRVFRTAAGHGPGRSDAFHPMREPSGISVAGVEFSHNDIFRAVHDIFGHVMFDNSFSARGEFRASHCHMWMYSADVHPVLFTEQIAQICWFYFGPHLTGGRPVRRYPVQKVFEFPQRFLDRFGSLFAPSVPEESR